MILVSYGQEGRPIQRVAERLVKAIRASGRRASAVAAVDLPGEISPSRGVHTLIAAWWRGLTPILDELSAINQIFVCLYDHETWRDYADEFLALARRADVVFACNETMLREARAMLRREGIATPAALMTDGVDTDAFSPGETTEREGPLRVGCVGDSAIERIKRLRLIRSAASALDGISVHEAAGILHADMPDWYRSLDLFVCASTVDGTPNPILEAAACGVPYISTPVGIVPELHAQTHEGGGWVVTGPNTREGIIDALRAALSEGRPGLRRRGSRCREAIASGWDWKTRQRPAVEAMDALPAQEPDDVPIEVPVEPDRVSSVLLVADVRGWAFDRNAQDLKASLSDRFDIDIAYAEDLSGSRASPDWNRYDVVFPFFNSFHLPVPKERTIGFLAAQYWRLNRRGPPDAAERAEAARHACLVVVNRRAQQWYEDGGVPARYLTNPVLMSRYPRPAKDWKKIRPCWAGNSRRVLGDEVDPKGYGLVVEACKKAKLELAVACYRTNRIPFDDMPSWYVAHNVLVCASSHEGSSNVINEAMASGLIIVTTAAGHIPELVESQLMHQGDTGIVVVERSGRAIADALLYLQWLPQRRLKRMGEINRIEMMERWSWDTWADKYAAVFEEVIEHDRQ